MSDRPPISPSAAAEQLLKRRRAQESFLGFCEYALEGENEKPAAHHRFLIDKLEQVEQGKIKKLMVTMPPGAAKTKYGSILFPAYYLMKRRRRKLILASYASDVAETNSAKLMSRVDENGPVLGYAPENRAVSRWRTTHGGEILATGVGSRVTSFRSDLTIIDDPVKGRAEADSETIRNMTWSWFWADLNSRSTPRSALVLFMTRWHEDDLAGRFLQTAREDWEVVEIPAEALENDPLGRAPGEFLWADPEYNYAAMLEATKESLRKAGSMREWQSLYQQDPKPGEGALFQVGKIVTIPGAPAGRRTRSWDLAATEKLGTRDPDYTTGALLVETPDKAYVVADMIRFRGGPDEVRRRIRETAVTDGKSTKISIPQDPGQAGKTQALEFVRSLVGYHVVSNRPTGNKSTRAAPFASQVNIGNVAFVAGVWNRELKAEMSSFPSGAHDDQIDALSDGFAALLTKGEPARRIKLNIMGR